MPRSRMPARLPRMNRTWVAVTPLLSAALDNQSAPTLLQKLGPSMFPPFEDHQEGSAASIIQVTRECTILASAVSENSDSSTDVPSVWLGFSDAVPSGDGSKYKNTTLPKPVSDPHSYFAVHTRTGGGYGSVSRSMRKLRAGMVLIACFEQSGDGAVSTAKWPDIRLLVGYR